MAPISTVDGAIARNNETGKWTFKFHYDRPRHTDPTLPDDTLVLVLVEGDDLGHEEAFHGLPGVEYMPHPLGREGTAKLNPRHVEYLKHFGVQPGDSAIDLALKAQERNSMLRMRGI